ncbi:MAG: SH3 domain-containing protein [Candidatus Promineifilaceae bacterium]|nr:SH3 domain-containing protein [Candidatus Promineifilaceae bacterium]
MNRRLLTLLLHLTIIIFLLTAGAHSVAAAENIYDNGEPVSAFVNTYALNVRAGPGITYSVVDVVRRGDEVTVTHHLPDSDWVRVVTPDDVSGWVNSFYLASNLKPFTFLPVWEDGSPPTTAGAFVNTYALNVRAGPGVAYSIVDFVRRGDELTVTHRLTDSEWVRVITPDDVTGWVNSGYLASNLKPFTFLPIWEDGATPTTAAARVNTYALNVRAGPGIAYSVVDVVRRGEELTVTHRLQGSQWVRVITPDDVTGWVNSFYLASNLKPFTFLPIWEDVPAMPDTADAWVNTYALNVRAGPGVAYSILDVARGGDKLTVTHRRRGSLWVHVITPDETRGWVNSFYLVSNLKPFTFLPVWEQTDEVLIYWLDGEELQGVPYMLPVTEDVPEAALEALLDGPPAGLSTAISTPEEVLAYPGRQPDWSDSVRLLDLTIVDGVATADFSQEMKAYGGGSARVQAIRAQITRTLLQFAEIDEVRIAVEGEVETALQP